jgi:hypothetical protein
MQSRIHSLAIISVFEVNVEFLHKSHGICDALLFQELFQGPPDRLTATDTSNIVSRQKADSFRILYGKVFNLNIKTNLPQRSPSIVLHCEIDPQSKNNNLHPRSKASLTGKKVISRDSTMRTKWIFLCFNDITGEILAIVHQKTI